MERSYNITLKIIDILCFILYKIEMSKTIDIKKVDSNFINNENNGDTLYYIDPRENDSVKIYES